MHILKQRVIFLFLLYIPSLWANNITDCNVSSSLDTIYQCNNYPKEIQHESKSKENVFSSFVKFLDKTKKLLSANQDTREKDIQVKKKSLRYGSYKVVRGDIFRKIAKKFAIPMHKLLVLNHLGKDSLLKVGQILKIPLSQHKINAIQRRAMKSKKNKPSNHSLRVTATAYSSEIGQTDSTPFIAAWNNKLKPGMKIIAVSRDLLHKHGLKNGTKVHISGLNGYYTVRDKMHKRFKKRIDIYKGINTRSALRWGKRIVMIHW